MARQLFTGAMLPDMTKVRSSSRWVVRAAGLFAIFVSLNFGTPANAATADPPGTAYLVTTTSVSAAPRAFMAPIYTSRSIYLTGSYYRFRATFRPTWQASPTETLSDRVYVNAGTYTMAADIRPQNGYYVVTATLYAGTYPIRSTSVPYYTNSPGTWDAIWGMKIFMTS